MWIYLFIVVSQSCELRSLPNCLSTQNSQIGCIMESGCIERTVELYLIHASTTITGFIIKPDYKEEIGELINCDLSKYEECFSMEGVKALNCISTTNCLDFIEIIETDDLFIKEDPENDYIYTGPINRAEAEHAVKSKERDIKRHRNNIDKLKSADLDGLTPDEISALIEEINYHYGQAMEAQYELDKGEFKEFFDQDEELIDIIPRIEKLNQAFRKKFEVGLAEELEIRQDINEWDKQGVEGQDRKKYNSEGQNKNADDMPHYLNNEDRENEQIEDDQKYNLFKEKEEFSEDSGLDTKEYSEHEDLEKFKLINEDAVEREREKKKIEDPSELENQDIKYDYFGNNAEGRAEENNLSELENDKHQRFKYENPFDSKIPNIENQVNTGEVMKETEKINDRFDDREKYQDNLHKSDYDDDRKIYEYVKEKTEIDLMKELIKKYEKTGINDRYDDIKESNDFKYKDEKVNKNIRGDKEGGLSNEELLGSTANANENNSCEKSCQWECLSSDNEGKCLTDCYSSKCLINMTQTSEYIIVMMTGIFLFLVVGIICFIVQNKSLTVIDDFYAKGHTL